MAGGLLLLAGGAAAALAAGLAGAPEVPAVFKTPAGDYTPAAPAAAWARYCGLSVSVAALKDSLATAEVDWEAVRAAYADGQEGAWDAAAAVYTGCGTDNVHGAPRNALYD